jgi:large subunit ribosomal protein L15
MPIGPFRTYSQPINLRDLDRVFEAGDAVTIETLVEKGLLKNTKTDVKILGTGELSKKLAVTAHSFSASAREKIEAAGGSVTALKEPKPKKQRAAKPRPAAADEPETEVAETEAEAPAEES